jgi:hypothetical protein
MSQTTTDHVKDLLESGFTIVPEVLSGTEVVDATELVEAAYAESNYAARNPEEGFNYASSIETKDPFFREVLVLEPVLSIARSVLGPDCVFTGFVSMERLKGFGHQDLHRDAPWDASLGTRSIITLWVLDGMDRMNGATRLIPGTHRSDEEPAEDDERVVYAETGPGSVVIIDAHVIHAASENQDGRRRRVMHASYARKGAEPPAELPADLRADLSPDQRRLFGL